MARRTNSPAPSASKAAAREEHDEVDHVDITVHLTAHSPLIAVVAVLVALGFWFHSQINCALYNKAGTYCKAGAEDGKYAPELCPLGSYCLGSWNGPTPCPAGTIFNGSVGSTNKIVCASKCAAGTFSNVTGFQGACSICNATSGSYCAEGSTSEKGTPCPPGYTCAGGASLPVVVMAGHFSLAGANVSTPCPAGTFSNATNVTSVSGCKPCGKGTYNGATGQTACKPASRGFTATNTTAQTPCPTGHYQSEEGKTTCEKCKKGTFNDLVGQAACSAALKSTDEHPGYFVNTEGAVNQTVCPNNTVAKDNGLHACEQCPVGSKSNFNNGTYIGCTPCSPGTYGAIGSESMCEKCPAGTRGEIEGAINIGACTKCPEGTYADAATNTCVECSSQLVGKGKYCPAGGAEAGGAKCLPMKICEGGANAARDIKENHYVNTVGDEVACEPGTYLPSSKDYKPEWVEQFKSLVPCQPKPVVEEKEAVVENTEEKPEEASVGAA